MVIEVPGNVSKRDSCYSINLSQSFLRPIMLHAVQHRCEVSQRVSPVTPDVLFKPGSALFLQEDYFLDVTDLSLKPTILGQERGQVVGSNRSEGSCRRRPAKLQMEDNTKPTAPTAVTGRIMTT